MKQITRRLFLRQSVAASVVAPAVVAATGVVAEPRQVRDVMEELERLIQKQTGVGWSVMLAANETIILDGMPRLPMVCFARSSDGTPQWQDKYGVVETASVTT